jgi:hypothetical protein
MAERPAIGADKDGSTQHPAPSTLRFQAFRVSRLRPLAYGQVGRRKTEGSSMNCIIIGTATSFSTTGAFGSIVETIVLGGFALLPAPRPAPSRHKRTVESAMACPAFITAIAHANPRRYNLHVCTVQCTHVNAEQASSVKRQACGRVVSISQGDAALLLECLFRPLPTPHPRSLSLSLPHSLRLLGRGRGGI